MRFFGLFFLVFFLFACSPNRVPKDVLPQEKMEAVLWDVLLADQTAEYYMEQDTAVKALEKHTELYQQVLEIHKISKGEFKKSLQFYEAHPQLLKSIFDSLQKRAEKSIEVGKPVPVS